MKPLHSALIRLHRCPCCQSRYTYRGYKGNDGKTAARQLGKREVNKELRNGS